jgi:MFS family permease
MTPPTDPGGTFTRGTLVYTRRTLVPLFFWILWGDFCLQFMESVVPGVLPLLMGQWKVPALFIGLFVTTIPSFLNFLITPLVSVWSDRHRGRLGRRIPFLLAPTPFVVLFLLGIAGTGHLAGIVHGLLGGAWSVDTCRIVILGIMVTAFQVANMVVNSVYYYLFNDVVPEPLMGRFLGLFRVVSIAAGACFSFFALPHAGGHAEEIFAWSALVYGLGFGLMCLKVREGRYPEPEQLGHGNPFRAAFHLLRDCFSTPFLRSYAMFCAALSFSMAWNPFLQLMRFNAGLSYAEVGMLLGISSAFTALVSYPAGILVDRYRPFAVATGGMVLFSAGHLLYLPVFAPAAGGGAFWIMAAAILISTLGMGIFQGAAMPLHMHVFPPGKYGQFCGSLGITNALGSMAGGLFAGLCTGAVLDGLGTVASRVLAPVGMFVSLALCLALLVRSWRLWISRPHSG